MFDRPRVFADPFGSFLDGRRQAEKDEIAFQTFRSQQRQRNLDSEAQAFRNALDRELAADERRLALDTRAIANEAASLELGLNTAFSPTERLQGIGLRASQITGSNIDNRRGTLQADALEFNNSLDRLFGTEERATALAQQDAGIAQTQARTQGIQAQTAGQEFNNSLDRQFATEERAGGIALTDARTFDTRRGRQNTNTIGPATQAVLNSVLGTAPAPQQNTAPRNDTLSNLDRFVGSGQQLSEQNLTQIRSLYGQALQSNPALADTIARQYPNLAPLLQ